MEGRTGGEGGGGASGREREKQGEVGVGGVVGRTAEVQLGEWRAAMSKCWGGEGRGQEGERGAESLLHILRHLARGGLHSPPADLVHGDFEASGG